jgi:hypothetical protein
MNTGFDVSVKFLVILVQVELKEYKTVFYKYYHKLSSRYNNSNIKWSSYMITDAIYYHTMYVYCKLSIHYSRYYQKMNNIK